MQKPSLILYIDLLLFERSLLLLDNLLQVPPFLLPALLSPWLGNWLWTEGMLLGSANHYPLFLFLQHIFQQLVSMHLRQLERSLLLLGNLLQVPPFLLPVLHLL